MSWSSYAAIFAACTGLWLMGLSGPILIDYQMLLSSDGYPGIVFIGFPFVFGLLLLVASFFLYRRRAWARWATTWLIAVWLAVIVVLVVLFSVRQKTWIPERADLLFHLLGLIQFPAVLLLLLAMRPVVAHFSGAAGYDTSLDQRHNHDDHTA
jgi:phosphatidylserine synthase